MPDAACHAALGADCRIQFACSMWVGGWDPKRQQKIGPSLLHAPPAANRYTPCRPLSLKTLLLRQK